MKKVKVYIASPYRLGDKDRNVKRQIDAFHELLKRGFSPFAPLLNHYVDQEYPHSEQEWLSYDFDWLDVCDCVLRLEGESAGADEEVSRHRLARKPVFFTINDLLKTYGVM